MENLRQIDWSVLENETGTNWIFSENSLMQITDVDREGLLGVDKYVTCIRPLYDPNRVFVTIYKIKERILDDKNNLILFTESESYVIE